MLWLFWILTTVYVLMILEVITLWWKSVDVQDGITSNQERTSVSVIVPFRNEGRNLPFLIESLDQQSYKKFEVVFVNDHSGDNSLEILQEKLQRVSFDFQLLSLDQEEGKKAAIAYGINHAKGEVMLTTDADCTFGPNWVGSMAGPFSRKEVQLVTGPVRLLAKTLFQRWQQMEFMTLITVGAATVKAGFPTMANGANLAYRKEAFQKVNGFEGIMQSPSGDDELLMMKVQRAFPGGVVFQKSKGALVETLAIKTWSGFKQQRLRWASKWKVGSRWTIRLIAISLFLYHLTLILIPLAYLSGFITPDDLLGLLGTRLVAELVLLRVITGFYDAIISLRAFLLHQLLYPFYVIYFGLMANFGNYQWKGRSYTVRRQ